MAGAGVGIFLGTFGRAVQEHERGGLVPQAKNARARRGGDHQHLDADLVFLDELLDAFARPVPAAERDRDPVEDVLDALRDEAEMRERKTGTGDEAGEQRVAQRRVAPPGTGESILILIFPHELNLSGNSATRRRSLWAADL